MLEPEPVFDDMKNDRDFKRFLPRGLSTVNLEIGWLSLAHNLLKSAAVDAKNQGAEREQTA
ncbi:transposase [Paenibacillus woosongensis]|uniref:transposase n=1 Tax=Paenibacillus woosongensis TaxID=307580 RepID=UPI001E4E6E13|nr:transposase [Paenibacillus woosongensis]